MKHRLWFFALMLCGVWHPCLAVVTDGNLLLAKCGHVDQAMEDLNSNLRLDAYWCYGYVEGSGAGFNQAVSESSPTRLCVPEGVTVGQAAKVVLQYLRAHPEELHLPAAKLVVEAIRGAFQCK